MAYEALDSLQQTLTQILKRDDDLTTHRVKQDIISIHDKAIALQLNLKAFPEKETIREVASTTLDIIEYLFSPENLSDCGSIAPSAGVSNRLRELAEELDSIVRDMVDYCKINDVWQQGDYPVLGIHSHRLERLADKILWRRRDLTDYFWSNDDSVNKVRRLNDSSRSAPTSNGGIDEDMSYSAAGTVSSSSRPAPIIKDGVVGFEEDLMQILDRLTSGSRHLQVFPIVGMAGIGKTTLVKIVYDHPLIVNYFDIRSWVTISQDHNAEITLSNLLASLKEKGKGKGKGKEKGIEAQSDHYYLKNEIFKHCYLKNEISKHLRARRYLIVLDDIWSTKVWDDIGMLFPNHHNGSRVLLTTRLWDVAAYAPYFSPIREYLFLDDQQRRHLFMRCNIHMVRFLDDQQSWDLFQRKVFADQTCPLELQSAAKKIVRSCGGLPLSIVTVAELLSRIGRTPKLWEQIVATDGNGQLESIFSLSYDHLPHHLKDCFLYMAGFPEDYEIRVSELIKLWVAEGFLNHANEGFLNHANESKSLIEQTYWYKSLEEMAEEYLKDLVEKSLVLVTSRKTDGKIKSCRLQNNVRDFCVRQAGQKKFLLPVMDYLPTPILRRHFLPQLLKNHRRISATWYDLDLKDSMHSSYTHSIICIPQRGYRLKVSVRNFSLLRVLHVLRRDDHSYWELGQVFDLIHLTYLASNIPSSIVPPAISKLHNLQTLIIYRYGVRLPVEIWRMRQLRHLIAFSFDPLPRPEAAALPLNNLQTLSLATNLVCSRRMVEMIPNIQKLGICYSGENFGKDFYCLDYLEYMRRLVKLKLKMLTAFCPRINPVFFPPSLKKLTLSGFRLAWRYMRITSLPNLQVLRLRKCAFDEEQWKTTDGKFPSLRLLLIDDSNLQHWTTTSSHFPVLECLMLHRCEYLSEIPKDIGHIPTLELIEVDDHNKSLFSSAKKIQVEQWHRGHDHVEVRLKHF